ncbi:hypothetical protein BOTBODRAFT_404881 [Botryobasidium botryosum FD-172 SS1]|uniref:Major facilitator superfamily (MFS) profile domain-containing protein n=1 Tax=Botryobasidium botryosum (strain FD-172 SS1) TaxID=930990 RepID=A0A067MAX8_BOTB1|nr:hypothetical protein BOTBODRAFT_404881 [Botryobasidium botryosum FD-172 SS1]
MRSETTRLLARDDEEELFCSPEITEKEAASVTPLPWGPLTIILLLNMVAPMAFELIYPFVNQMIVDIGVVEDPELVGFYSGLVESSFCLFQLLTILPCSYASDRFGRKPVIVIGMAGLAVSMIFFPLSRSLSSMIMFRCLSGALGGCWAAIKIMVGEMTDKTNQSLAFTGLGITYRIGQIIGLPLGGFLSHPERTWEIFRSPFWLMYPYALPCFVGAGSAAIFVFLGAAFLSETQPSKVKKVRRPSTSKRTSYGSSRSSSQSSTASTDTLVNPEPKSLSMVSALTKEVVAVLISNLAMGILAEMMFSLYPLFGYTSIESGGLGIDESGIGMQMSVRALMHIVAFLGFEPLRSRMGTIRLYQCTMALWPISALFFPFVNYLARQYGSADAWPVRIALLAFFAVWSFCGFAWTCVGLMVTDVCPSPAAIAAVNGLSQMSIVLPQAIAPAAATSLFAYSIKSNVAGGNLIWIVFFVYGCLAGIHSLTLREPTTDWRLEKEIDE